MGPGGGNEAMDDIVKNAAASAGGGGSASSGGPTRTITFYKDCFQVDDGPLRYVNDPVNKKFLDEVSKGYAPRELQSKTGQAPEIQLVDKRSEDPPKAAVAKFDAFKGAGASLGSASTVSAGDTTVFQVTRVASAVDVSPSKPTTRIQIKLPDGKRVVGKFNKSHTVEDLKEFVNVNVPAGISAYQLLAAGRGPPKPIEAGTASLEDAGLCNASLTLKPVSK